MFILIRSVLDIVLKEPRTNMPPVGRIRVKVKGIEVNGYRRKILLALLSKFYKKENFSCISGNIK